MNRTERAYESRLKIMEHIGQIRRFAFESVKLRLADRTWYTPDFLVVTQDGSVEFHEVKGFWRDDARVKWKVAAELNPWARFVAAKLVKGKWEHEWYGAKGAGGGGSLATSSRSVAADPPMESVQESKGETR
jgi:hypothetical protein